MTNNNCFQAEEVIDGDRISVQLTGNDKNGKRFGVAYFFNASGQQVDANDNPIPNTRSLDVASVLKRSADAPIFPQEEFTAALEANDAQLQRDIETAFYEAVSEYQEAGGALLQDALLDSVYNFMRAEHGLQPEDHDGFVLQKDQVVVNAPIRISEDSPGTWTVQMAPTWG